MIHFITIVRYKGRCATSWVINLPMSTASSKHLMEGELSVKVLLYNVQPFSFSLLPLKLLQDRNKRKGTLQMTSHQITLSSIEFVTKVMME